MTGIAAGFVLRWSHRSMAWPVTTIVIALGWAEPATAIAQTAASRTGPDALFM
jgi:hypothetical protein